MKHIINTVLVASQAITPPSFFVAVDSAAALPDIESVVAAADFNVP